MCFFCPCPCSVGFDLDDQLERYLAGLVTVTVQRNRTNLPRERLNENRSKPETEKDRTTQPMYDSGAKLTGELEDGNRSKASQGF